MTFHCEIYEGVLYYRNINDLSGIDSYKVSIDEAPTFTHDRKICIKIQFFKDELSVAEVCCALFSSVHVLILYITIISLSLLP
jgi:hypothetical protein